MSASPPLQMPWKFVIVAEDREGKISSPGYFKGFHHQNVRWWKGQEMNCAEVVVAVVLDMVVVEVGVMT